MSTLRSLGIRTIPHVAHPADKVARLQAIMALPKHERGAIWDAMPTAELLEMNRIKADLEADEPGFNSGIKAKAERVCAKVDSLAPDLRQSVYRNGHSVVMAFVDHGVRNARSIDFLIAVARGQNGDGTPGHYGNHRVGPIKRMQRPA